MKKLFLILLVFFGCANAPKFSIYAYVDNIACQGNDFRGAAVSLDEHEALDMARVEISRQIQSSLKASSKFFRKQTGTELSVNTWQQAISQKSNLQNAQDAKLYRKKRHKDSVGVVVCMSRADAAKGLAERQRMVADSLELVSHAMETKHPKNKNNAWNRTQALWIEFLNIQNLLNNFGVPGTLLDSAGKIYSRAREDYTDYCRNQKIYWDASKDECSNLVFAELSKRIAMEKSLCLNGLRLRFACLEKCGSFSLGKECSFEPSLAIESCDGNIYSLLKPREPAKGYDMHNQSRARENLIEKLPSAAFFREWETEIKGWVPQCIE